MLLDHTPVLVSRLNSPLPCAHVNGRTIEDFVVWWSKIHVVVVVVVVVVVGGGGSVEAMEQRPEPPGPNLDIFPFRHDVSCERPPDTPTNASLPIAVRQGSGLVFCVLDKACETWRPLRHLECQADSVLHCAEIQDRERKTESVVVFFSVWLQVKIANEQILLVLLVLFK